MRKPDRSGYVGYSMSKRAAYAYDAGEMPKSKWTKTAMIEALNEWADDNDRKFKVDLSKMKKDAIFKEFFYRSSWHHTSLFMNPTDFYSIDELYCELNSEELTDEDRKNRDLEKQRAYDEWLRRVEENRLKKLAQKEKENKFFEVHGYAHNSVAAYLHRFPERISRTIEKEKGMLYLFRYPNGNMGNCYKSDLAEQCISCWSDLDEN